MSEETVKPKVRFESARDAVNWLYRHPHAEYSRKHDALSLKPTSLRIVAAFDFLRKVAGGGIQAYVSYNPKHGTEGIVQRVSALL